MFSTDISPPRNKKQINRRKANFSKQIWSTKFKHFKKNLYSDLVIVFLNGSFCIYSLGGFVDITLHR